MKRCTSCPFEFSAVRRLRIVARFDRGATSSDAGALLLEEVDALTGLLVGKRTLSRLELARDDASVTERYKRIVGEEPTLDALLADRTSAAAMLADQLRLYLHLIAFSLLHAPRRLGLAAAALANAHCDAIRLRLLEIRVRGRVSSQRLGVALAGLSAGAALQAGLASAARTAVAAAPKRRRRR